MSANDFFLRRGLTQAEAMAYFGVKRRRFDQIKLLLTPSRQGTSLIYDIHELDRVWDLEIARPVEVAQESVASALPMASVVDSAAGLAEFSSLHGRPLTNGAKPWVVKAASIRTQRESGKSTEFTEASAFNELLKRIRMPKDG